jgi:Leucine-rich repeat (LRR) protein
VVGTPDFIAPEQARNAHTADIRSDVYSLGCSLYYLLTGQVPFPHGSATEKLLKHVMDEPEPVEQLRPDVSPAIAAIVRKMMAKRPEKRYQTPAALVADLRAVLKSPRPVSGDQLITARVKQTTGRGQVPGALQVQNFATETLPNPQRLRRQASRRRWLWVSLAGGLVFLMSASVGAIILAPRGSPPASNMPALVQVTANKFDAQAQALNEWSNTVRQLPAEKQVEAVTTKLKELNPRFDGKVTSKVEQGVVIEFQFVTDAVTDLSPVRALPGLKTLTCSGSAAGKGKLADLSPLRELSLTALNCNATLVADLSPLNKMPLTSLHCSDTQVTDLEPLHGMPLTRLGCRGTPVADLSPLRGMKLISLQCDQTRVKDLKPLKGMPMQALECGGTSVTDLQPLQGMKLTRLSCPDTKVNDLEPLRGLKLTWLDCQKTPISELAPLQGMPLQTLRLGFTQVTNLKPLQESPLRSLDLRDSPVKDLSPLAKLPLRGLDVRGTKVVDWSPLKTIATLEQINDRPAKEFWATVPSK